MRGAIVGSVGERLASPTICVHTSACPLRSGRSRIVDRAMSDSSRAMDTIKVVIQVPGTSLARRVSTDNHDWIPSPRDEIGKERRRVLKLRWLGDIDPDYVLFISTESLYSP